MENQNKQLNHIMYPRTPGDPIAELNVANSDPDHHLSLGELMALDQAQSADSELSLDFRPKYVRTPDDEYAEKLVDWSEQNDQFKAEARMYVETMYGLKPGDPGEQAAYQAQLKTLQDQFGTPKPVKGSTQSS